MRNLGAALVVLLAVGTTGCARHGIPVEPAEPFLGNYVDVKAPAAEGWLLTHSGNGGMVFGKAGPSKAETFVAAVRIFSILPTHTPAEFEEFVRVGVRKDNPPERFDLLRESLKYSDERGYPCVRYQALAQDKRPAGRIAPLLLALDGLYCRHPKRKDTGFAVLYSFRGEAEHATLRSEAESFIQGVQVPGARALTGRVSEYGLYKKTSSGTLELLESTTRIPGRLGACFGYRYEVDLDRRPADVQVIGRHPPLIDEAGKESDGYSAFVLIGKRGESLWKSAKHYCFDRPEEIKPGRWLFEVRFEGAVLVQKEFEVVGE